MNQSVPKIRPFLLWDVDLEKFDFSQNQKLVIERVCTLGNLVDFKEIVRFYGLSVIKKELQYSAALDDKSINFFGHYFKIPKEQFKCYSKKPFLLQH